MKSGKIKKKEQMSKRVCSICCIRMCRQICKLSCLTAPLLGNAYSTATTEVILCCLLSGEFWKLKPTDLKDAKAERPRSKHSVLL